MATKLKTIINQRGGHRARCTTLMTQIREKLADVNSNTETIRKLERELRRQRDIIIGLDEDIIPLLEAEEISKDVMDSSCFIMEVDDVLYTISQRCTTNTTPVNDNDNRKSVKLPQIKLLTFDGNPLQFQKFWDLFKSSIHDCHNLSGVAKFHYLMTQLQGDAANLLSGFEHTEVEYIEAVKLLCETYGKPKRIIQARLHALFDLPSPRANAKDLATFRSQYEGHLRGLKVLGTNVTEAGFVFAEMLVRKLPKVIKDNLNRANKSDYWTLDTLRNAIDVEIGHLEAVDLTGDAKSNSLEYIPKSTVAFSATPKQIDNNSKKQCPLCRNSHNVIDCTTFKNASERKEKAIVLKLCFNCLKSSHNVSHCTNAGRCRKCGRKHHTALCQPREQLGPYKGLTNGKPNETSTAANNAKKNLPEDSKMIDKSLTILSQSGQYNQGQSGILPIAKVSVRNGSIIKETRILLDSGSQRSFITKKLVKDLQLTPVNTISLAVDGFSSLGEVQLYDVVKVVIDTYNESISIDATVIDTLPNRILMTGRSRCIEELLKSGHVLADNSVDSDNINDLGLLIGVDSFFKFVYGSQVKDNLYILPSKLGALVAGTVDDNNDSCNTQIATVLRVGVSDGTLDSQLENIWKLDSLGIDNKQNMESKTLDLFSENLKFCNGQYISRLPWKTAHPSLPTNFNLAKTRLESNIKKLRKQPSLLSAYDNVIKDQLARGFIEEVPKKDYYKLNDVHYLAHHGVFKDSVTTPIRVVMDCSAKASKTSPSLNDCLETGPSLMNNLLSILLRFRINKYAATADIEKAFLMVGLHEIDRDFTRFLWLENPADPKSKMRILRFRSVLFGAAPSQFLLSATLQHHIRSNSDENFANDFLSNIYVDNVYVTNDNEESLISYCGKSYHLLKAAGFTLREWSSNSQKLSQKFSEEYLLNSDHKPKILGMTWNTNSDNLEYIEPKLTVKEPFTKRSVVSCIAKFFDPLGLHLPISIKSRLLIQEIWQSGLGWDEELAPELVQRWKTISHEMIQLTNIKIQRCISETEAKLHIFADASTKAYGAVAYLVSNNESNIYIAKAKIAPIKAPSLPQLELTAIVIATRLCKFINENVELTIKISESHIWSDSSIAVGWIHSSKHKSSYVSTRVAEINNIKEGTIVHHVSSSDNPADLLTRGLSLNLLKTKFHTLWYHGPKWLIDATRWPKTNIKQCKENVSSLVINDCLVETQIPVEYRCSDFPMQIEKYGCLDKLLRVLSYVNRFIRNLKTKVLNSAVRQNVNVTPPDASEINDSEIMLIRHMQKYYFPDVYCYFNDVKKYKMPSLVKQLRLFVSTDGIVRCGGRLKFSDLDTNAKFPILLAPKSYLTKMYINSFHKQVHAGVNATLSSLRMKFWLPKGRQNVKSVIRSCIICKKVQGKPFSSVDIPHLPPDRVTTSNPFEVTCVDYSGALYVRDGTHSNKVYIALFTCAVTRAIHLELVENNSLESFINAFRRFCGRRSCPSIIYSDNAATFSAASNIFQNLHENPTFLNFLSNRRIKWKFIPSRAPWMGGAWERMVGLTKNALKKILGRSFIGADDLRTLLTEIEAGINDRPLTYCSDDNDELLPLTPSMLICGRRITGLPELIEDDEISDPSFNSNKLLIKKFKNYQSLLRQFWKRWSTEYLVSLRERDRNLVVNRDTNFKVGSIVLIGDENPRVNWKLGVIEKLNYGLDNNARSAIVRTSSGDLSRPIVKLYPLELYCNDDCNTEQSKDNVIYSSRVKRSSALEAERKIKKMFNET